MTTQKIALVAVKDDGVVRWTVALDLPLDRLFGLSLLEDTEFDSMLDAARAVADAIELDARVSLAPRRGPSAQSPRRLPSGSDSGTILPDVRYPGLGLFYARRRLGSHTPRTDGAASEARPDRIQPRDFLYLPVR